jgi:hypothetical protein
MSTSPPTVSAPTASSVLQSAEAIAINAFLPTLANINAAVQANPANASWENIIGGEGVSWLAQLQADVPNLQEAEAQFLLQQGFTFVQGVAAAQLNPAPTPSTPATPLVAG